MLILLFAATVFSAKAQPQTIDGVVAVVGTRTVLLSDVETQALQYGENTDRRAVRCQVLDGLLTQKLLVTQAVLDSIEVTDD
ncbi:MAG TPA: hypothetical protein VEY71_09945, partial [Chitinophagales bacterium]|nr:hypothetical protein [Chitinophagales bacterium]